MTKVDRSKFSEFIKNIRLKGDFEIKQAIFDFKKDNTISVIALTTNRIVASYSIFEGEEVEELGRIGIGDLKLFHQFVDSFKDEILEMKALKNKLKLSTKRDKLEISAIIMNPEYIKNSIPDGKESEFFKKLEDGRSGVINIDSFQIDNLLKYTSYLKTEDIIIRGDKNKLQFGVTKNENEVLASIDVGEELEPFTIKVKTILLDIMSLAEEKLHLGLKENHPVFVGFRSDYSSHEYLLAPSTLEG